jgi:AsmA protein
VEVYRGRIETAAATATGRPLHIVGPVRLTIFPHLGLKAQEVTLANVPGGKASVMLAVGDIDLSLQLLPLFQGKIALDKIILTKPTIALEVDPDGNPNWQFGKESPKTAKQGTLTLPSGTAFNGIEVTDGRVTYDNAKTHTHRAIEHVNLKVDITTIDQPVRLTGDLAIAERKLVFEGQLATLKTFLGSGTTGFGIAVDSELMKADFNGHMLPDGTTDGRFQLTSPSLRDLSGWLGQPLPAGGLGPLALSSRIINKDKVTSFENLKVSLDHQNMTGTLTVDASQKIPLLTGTLAADRLDFDPYLGGGTKQATVKKQPGWSHDKISFALLKEFNSKLVLSTGSLTAQGVHLGRTSLRLDVDNGVLHAVLDQISLYGGTGQAEATVDTRGAVPLFANRVSLHGVALRPFLHDTLHLDTIDGSAAVILDLRFAGDNANAILHSLSGQGSLQAANGRFRGVDLGQVAKTISVLLGGAATSDVATTDFHAMGASFTLWQGILTTKDFHLAGPVVQMSGQGGIDMGNRTIDFRLRPGAAVAGLSFGVPFRIRGGWDKLHYSPDVEAIIGGAVDNLKNGASALEGLFTGPKKGEKQGQKKTMGDSLKSMFGIH